MKLSKYIDHTLLKADATRDEIITLCKEAKEYDFKIYECRRFKKTANNTISSTITGHSYK